MTASRKLLLTATILLSTVGFANSASATLIDFTGLTPGSSVSNQYAAQDLNVAAITTNGVSSAASILQLGLFGGTQGVTNAPASSNGNYPTDEFLSFSFTTAPVNNLSFTFDNIGSNGNGVNTGSSYTAYGVGNTVISTGNLSNVNNALVDVAGSNIRRLVVDNSFTDTFSGGGNNWIVSVANVSYSVSSAPLPAGLPMFGAALLGMFALRRRKELSAIA